MLREDRDNSPGGVADSGDDVGVGNGLDLADAVLLFVAVLLGVGVSIVLAAWVLSVVAYVATAGMFLTPVQLLALVARVVKRRALADWHAARSRPLVVRLVRAFWIGFLWPLWLVRS